MIAWLNTHVRFREWPILNKIWLAVTIAVIITSVIFSLSLTVSASTDQVVGFSARLKNANGSVVPDGHYNVQFKLYNQPSGGTSLWTETHYDVNGTEQGQDNRLRVINGYLSAKLGSITPFSQNIDWNDQLWLTMNIGGVNQEPIIANISWDGEMSPRIQLTATPYSINSNAVGGKTADQLTQLGQGQQTDASNSASININKTGSGSLIELQSSGVDIFKLSQSGNITLGTNSDKTISIGDASDGIGQNFTIVAGGGVNADLSSGGNLILQGGSATGAVSTGGGVVIDSGAGVSGNGSVNIGTTNAGSIDIGNSESTTKIEGKLESNNLDSTGQSALEIGSTNATSIVLGQDTTINGDTLIKNAQNSASALQVQNSDNESAFAVDTQNNQVKIGSADTTATSLILDTKTSAGDPVGVDGAMYYNSQLSKFRCYENSAWKDCITPLPVSKVASADTSNSSTTPVDVTDLSFNLSANTKYYYKFVIIHESADTVTGVGFGTATPNAPTANNWCVNTSATTSSAARGHWGSYCGFSDASATTSGSENIGKYFTSNMEGYIETDEDAGNLTLRLKSESTSEVTVKQGSFGILQVVQ